MRKIFNLLIAIVFLWSVAVYAAVPMTATGTLGNDQWYIESDGDIIPNTDSALDIGESGNEVDNIWADSLWLGGVEITGASEISSPMADETGYVRTMDGGTKVRLYDAGYIQLGDGTTDSDYYLKLDGADDDWAVGIDTTTDDYTISLGGAFATDNRLAITDDANNTIITIGDGATYDQYLVFDGVQDFYFGVDDTGGDAGEDTMVWGAGSTVNTTPGLAISSTGLIFTKIGLDCMGAADMDYGSADVTDHTFTTDSTGDAEIVLPNDSIGDAEIDWSGLTTSHGLIIGGATPTLTVGDGGVEDNWVFFNNSAATDDWSVGVDDTGDDFEICNGANLDATCAISISASEDVTLDSGSLYMVDDESVYFGTDSDWYVNYDESVDNQLLFLGIGTTCAATTDPMFEILVDATTATGSNMVANQQVFGVAKGTQASNTVLLTLDEDGDTLIAASLAISGGDDLLTVSTDDELRFASNDEAAVLCAYGFDDKDAKLCLDADTGDDTTDTWWLVSNQSGNAFTILNHTTTYLTIDDADGDITTAGDVEIIDDMDLVFGSNSDWLVQYDEGVDDQLIFVGVGTTAGALTDPMFEVLTGASMTANQQCFGVSKGTQASNTALFTVDEDGDVIITGSAQFQTSIFATGHFAGTSAMASATTGIGSGSSMAYGIFTKDLTSIQDSGTLTAGTVGQMITIIAGSRDGSSSWTLTPATKTGFTSLTFDAEFETVTLLWLDATRGWIIIGSSGATIA